jgi:hypothetical protein
LKGGEVLLATLGDYTSFDTCPAELGWKRCTQRQIRAQQSWAGDIVRVQVAVRLCRTYYKLHAYIYKPSRAGHLCGVERFWLCQTDCITRATISPAELGVVALL